MAAKEYNARVQHKRDTDENLSTANPVLLDGEIVVVSTADGKRRTKTGDGIRTYSQLPFDDEDVWNAINTKSAMSYAVNATLTAGGWSYGRQTVTIDGLKAESNGMASLAYDCSEEQRQAAAAANLRIVSQNEGNIIFTVDGDEPNIDIPIIILVLG